MPLSAAITYLLGTTKPCAHRAHRVISHMHAHVVVGSASKFLPRRRRLKAGAAVLQSKPRGSRLAVRRAWRLHGAEAFRAIEADQRPREAFTVLLLAGWRLSARCASISDMIVQAYVCVLYCSPCAPLMAPWLGELEGTSLAILYLGQGFTSTTAVST